MFTLEHVKLIAMKFLFSLVILGIILGAGFDVSFGNVFLITLVLTAVSYAIVDLMILSRSSNTTATISDFVLTFVVVYFMTDALTVGDSVFLATLISTISLTIFEYFFHQSVARNLDGKEERTERVNPTAQLSTEASEEIYPYDEEE
ncbi:YndM family protein [Halobacillus sp. BBL2006]|uniref:YndM family protein n=1 Tax=Halobacillus sp. BBL2006 TaxID=1543706 RepID=UPI001E33FDAF|nr:YndM family protein [Halobacillus sp. BBL2006]